MTRYLVVAHKTLVGPHLLDLVEEKVRSGPCDFHLVVPAVHPSGHPWTEGEITATAEALGQPGLGASARSARRSPARPAT